MAKSNVAAGSADKAAADLDNARIFISMAMRRTRRALRARRRRGLRGCASRSMREDRKRGD